MNTTKKILILIAAIVLISLSGILGWYYGFKSGIQAGGMTKSMADFTLINDHLTDQLANASCEGAKKALIDFIQILERNRNLEGSLVTETSYYVDKMMTHIRLARIEKQLGNKDEEIRHIKIAKEACASRKWPDCSTEKIMTFTKRAETKSPIACLVNEK
jgi:hypothetical protein